MRGKGYRKRKCLKLKLPLISEGKLCNLFNLKYSSKRLNIRIQFNFTIVTMKDVCRIFIKLRGKHWYTIFIIYNSFEYMNLSFNKEFTILESLGLFKKYSSSLNTNNSHWHHGRSTTAMFYNQLFSFFS